MAVKTLLLLTLLSTCGRGPDKATVTATCEQAVTDSCVDACHDTVHGCDCTLDALTVELAQCIEHHL